MRQQEHRSERAKGSPKGSVEADKCEQVRSDLENAAKEAVQAGNAADMPALVAQAVRKARAEFDQMATNLPTSTATAQALMEVDSTGHKRPLEKASKGTTDDYEDDVLPDDQAIAGPKAERRRSTSPRKEHG